jgi:hypothetical protein
LTSASSNKCYHVFCVFHLFINIKLKKKKENLIKNKMTSVSEKKVKFYLKDSDIESSVLSGSSAHERYIILMNETLQFQNQENILKIRDLEEQVAVFENDIGRSEARATNLKGLLKNFHEMDSQLREVAENQAKVAETIRSGIFQFKKKSLRHLRALQTIMIAFVAFSYEFMCFYDFLPILFIMIVIAAFQESNLSALQIADCEEHEQKIKELNEKIKITVKSQDYIYEFLDDQ